MHVNKSVSFQIDIKTEKGGVGNVSEEQAGSFERKFISVGLCMITSGPGEQTRVLRF